MLGLYITRLLSNATLGSVLCPPSRHVISAKRHRGNVADSKDTPVQRGITFAISRAVVSALSVRHRGIRQRGLAASAGVRRRGLSSVHPRTAARIPLAPATTGDAASREEAGGGRRRPPSGPVTLSKRPSATQGYRVFQYIPALVIHVQSVPVPVPFGFYGNGYWSKAVDEPVEEQGLVL